MILDLIMLIVFLLNIGIYQVSGSAINLFCAGFMAGMYGSILLDRHFDNIIVKMFKNKQSD